MRNQFEEDSEGTNAEHRYKMENIRQQWKSLGE